MLLSVLEGCCCRRTCEMGLVSPSGSDILGLLPAHVRVVGMCLEEDEDGTSGQTEIHPFLFAEMLGFCMEMTGT